MTGSKRVPERIANVLRILDDKKVEDPVVLDVAELVGYTDFLIIASGRSSPHVQAMAEAVAASLKIKGQRGLHLEGDPAATWVLIDGGDFVLHLFQPDARRYYALEDLWDDAPRLKSGT